MISFIRNLLGVKTDQAVKGAMEALVRWDPKAATEAEMRTMEQHLDELGLQVAETRITLDRERNEADQIKALSAQRMAAAEELQRRLDAATDPTEKAGIEKSLAIIVGLLEEMTPDVEREERDAIEAAEFLEILEKNYVDAGAKLKAARADLGRAEREMQRAEQQREIAERQTEAARRAAGLSNSGEGLSVALQAMKTAAEKSRVEAEAANAKAKLLRPTQPEKEDANIAAAMAVASGAGAAPKSLSDRLAALKGKK